MTEAWHLFVDFLDTHVRRVCVTSPFIFLPQIVFDLAIGYVYIRIPALLRRILRAAGGDRVTGAAEIKSFSIFVGACGVSHLFGVVVLFYPTLDWPRVGWLLWTAVVSWRTLRMLRKSEIVVIAALRDRQSLEARLGDGTT